MKLYKIRNWAALFENNRSRTVKDLAWVPIPNRHDGENFSLIMANENGAEIFAAWVLILQVASRCQPRGSLVRDNQKPHTAATLSIKTRAPEKWFKIALNFLESETDWLEITDDCQPPVIPPSGGCHPPDEEGNGKKGMEGNGKGGKPPGVGKSKIYKPESRVALHYLNEQSGKHFRESETSLAPINARLSEEGVTIEGVKQMIARQSIMWKDTRMQEYLRPETLFGKEKFNSYYAAKDLPVNFEDKKSGQPKLEKNALALKIISQIPE